jgi:conjugal transfer mating pair stabilization protein TraG
MESVIYTFGGGEALWKVFNGIAIIFSSGSGYMTSIMKLSMAIGGLWAAFRAILGANMGLFGKDYFVPTYLILNLLLIPTTSVHIVDEVNPGFKYSKVDHVPVGIAVIASTASQISKLVTNTIEGAFTAVEANQYGKTGPMFAARLVSMSRHMTVTDPVMRQNLKDFVRQCFTLPLVWTNMLAGKKAALETTDILGLIESHPHSWLGSYWRDSGGNTTFLYCKEGVKKAKEVMKLEVPTGLVGLATNLFGDNNVDALAANKRLKTYFDDAWVTLSKKTASAHEVAGQQMMMNIYRESSDDKREEFGLARRNPELVALSSARAKMQQNTGFLASFQMVSQMLPSLQSTMLAILCIMFVVIVPMTMLPGGLKTLGMWVKLIIWVESWPIFFAIINCVSLIMASGRGAALVSTGAGLSLLTQNDLADAAWDAYCYAESFMVIVPIIAWAVISQSGYALANLAGTITRSVDGLSSKIGSEITDGNLSFDNQSFNNRSIAGYQLAQQQLGSSFNFGESYDDGRFRVTTDTRGKDVIQEQQTNLSTNVTSNDNIAATLSESGEKSLSAANQKSVMASNSLSQGLQELYSFANHLSKGKGLTDGFGNTDTIGANQELRKTKDVAYKFAQDNKISDDKAFQILAHAGADTGALKFLGIDAGIKSEVRMNSSDNSLIEKAKNSGISDQFSNSLSNGWQKVVDNKGSITDQSQRQAIDSIQGSFQNAKQHSEQAQASLTQAENYRKAATFIKSSGGNIVSNLNDEALDYVGAKMGMDRKEVAHWQNSHKAEYEAEASKFLAERLQPFIDEIGTSHPMSEGQIRETANEFLGKVPNTIDRSDIDSTKRIADKNDVGDRSRQKMESDVSKLRGDTDQSFKEHDGKISTGKSSIEQEQQVLEKAYDKRKNDGVIIGGVKNMTNEGIQTAKDLGSGFQKFDDSLSSKINEFKGVSPASQPSPITVEKLSPTEASPSLVNPSGRESSSMTSHVGVPGKNSSGNVGSEFRSSPTDKGISEPSFTRVPSVGSNRSTGSSPTSFGGFQNHPSQSIPSSGISSEIKETASGNQGDMQPSTYVRSMEDGIDQGRAANKMASQGRQIKQLKDSIEMNKSTLQEEVPLDMTSSPKVES